MTGNTQRRWQCLISSISVSGRKNLHDCFFLLLKSETHYLHYLCAAKVRLLTFCLNSSEQIPTHGWLREQLNLEIILYHTFYRIFIVSLFPHS